MTEGLSVERPPEEPDEPGDEEVEPVELLVQLAKRGEIEPWDIDIVAVTDSFLAALDESDLRTTGRALFYASVLLRMKSDALMEEPEPDEPEPAPWELADEGELPMGDPVEALESEMERRLDRKSARGTPETLDELVRELRDAERGSWWKASRTYDTSESPKGFRRGVQTLDYRADDSMRLDDEPTQADALGTAHQEDIDEITDEVQVALDEQYAAGRAEVLYEEISTAGGTRIETFLALLFLAHRGSITLEQDELFGDLWIRDARGLAEVEEAVAD
ncbi:MAG TPA: ScpA family protein [Halobacteriales archaeon]|nr:ScpA family protein [Halobacteriales archaeon]